MLKITNLNFENKTIDSIELNCETIDDLEIKLTKSKFNIVFKSEGKLIKREFKQEDEVVDLIIEDEVVQVIKEEAVVTEKIEVAVEDPVDMQEPVAPEQEPVVMEDELVTLEVMKELLQNEIPKKNTMDSYFRAIQQVYNHFKIADMSALFKTKEQDIIDYIESKYTNTSTIKSKLCSIYKACNILKIETQILKSRIDFYVTNQTLEQDKTKDANKKTTDEGDAIIEHFKNHLDQLKKKIQNDIDLLNNWSLDVQLYIILKIYLTFGVIRSSELIDCKITETDDDTPNYINVETSQIVINIHKNDKVNGKKVIDISEDTELLDILRKGIGKYLITTQQGEVYQSSSAFAKLFRRQFGFCVYDLRKAVSSKCIAEGNIENIHKLEAVQGHTLPVILEFYNVYNKK